MSFPEPLVQGAASDANPTSASNESNATISCINFSPAGVGTILRIDTSFQSPARSLAIDDQMLLAESASQVLRIWEPKQSLVVLGRSSPAEAEVNLDACQHDDVWVGRRVSGGQTIVSGPGCLMYAVVLDYQTHPELRMLDHAHKYVMTRMKQTIASLGVSVEINGCLLYTSPSPRD